MAGSKTWREYRADTGELYSINMDESNARAIAPWNGQELAKLRTANHRPFPIGFTPRVLHTWCQSNPKRKRDFIVGNPAVYGDQYLHIGQLYVTTENPSEVWIVTGYRGESIRTPTYYFQTDTGLDDGSPSQ